MESRRPLARYRSGAPKGQRPTMQFHGEAAAIAAKLGTKNIALSITHTSEQALAHVILEN